MLLLRPRKLFSTPTTKPLSLGKLRTLVTNALVSYQVPMLPGDDIHKGRCEQQQPQDTMRHSNTTTLCFLNEYIKSTPLAAGL